MERDGRSWKDEEKLERARELIRAAGGLLIGAGAGMGVDSGLPDFRGNEGFWRAYPPLKDLNLSFIQMANPRFFSQDPALAWGFYGHRMNLYREIVPHGGFAILRRWGESLKGGAFVYTSNVDGHFQEAGFSPSTVVECHGSIHHLQCTRPCCEEIWDADDTEVVVDESTFRARPPLPRCLHCGAVARPNILMFGDWSWVQQRSEEQMDSFQGWLGRLDGPIVAVECGAGTAVPSVRFLCEEVVNRHGGALIRINPREAFGPSGTLSLAGGALEVLRAIDRGLFPSEGA